MNSVEWDFSGAKTGQAVEERLARLEDVEAIKALKARYALYCDDGYDAEGIASLFIEEGTWENEVFGTFRGREEIRDFFARVSADILWALHFMICPSVTVLDEGRAHGTWYLFEPATMKAANGGQPDAVVMSGTYFDTFVKVDGEWRFEHMRPTLHQVSNLDEGWVRQQFRP